MYLRFFLLSLFCLTFLCAEEYAQPYIMPEITPPCYYPISNPVQVKIGGDLLVWTAREDGLDYAVSGFDSSGVTTAKKEGRTHGPGFRWDLGFKAYLDVNVPHDGWDVKLEYTWFLNKDMETNIDSATLGLPIYSTWIYDPDDTIQYADKVGGDWRLYFQDMNIELGRCSYISPLITLRPYIGLKGSWQVQTNNAQYHDILGNDVITNSLVMKENFWGIGPRGGADLNFDLVWNWKIITNFATSLLYSRFSTDMSARMPSEPGDPIEAKIEDHIRTITPVFEFQGGFQWGTLTYEESFGLIIQLMFETQSWLNMNRFYNGFGTRNGNLGLYGFTMKIAFNF
ncbi:MAG: Lpg1974 family pore-forming outer membrane protein [Simkaniaceae bacterium]|nr:Lpg1974 family pore-forming outer membrane protein [Simkaniaceae bacterium]